MVKAMDPHAKGSSLALSAAAGLLRLSASTIWRTVKSVESTNWTVTGGVDSAIGQQEPDDTLGTAALLKRLTRAALGVRACHGSSVEYQHWLARLEAEGLDIGAKYHTRHHYADTIFLCARYMQCLDDDDRRHILGGLGIPSNFALLFDGVPLGGVSAHGRHGRTSLVSTSVPWMNLPCQHLRAPSPRPLATYLPTMSNC